MLDSLSHPPSGGPSSRLATETGRSRYRCGADHAHARREGADCPAGTLFGTAFPPPLKLVPPAWIRMHVARRACGDCRMGCSLCQPPSAPPSGSCRCRIVRTLPIGGTYSSNLPGVAGDDRIPALRVGYASGDAAMHVIATIHCHRANPLYTCPVLSAFGHRRDRGVRIAVAGRA